MQLILTIIVAFCCQISLAKQRINNNPFPVGSYYHGEVNTNPSAVSSTHRRMDISNKQKNNILTKPVAFNIYVGKVWKQSSIDIIDTFAKNIGATDLWGVLQTLPNPDGTKPAPLVFQGSGWDQSVDDTKPISYTDTDKWIQDSFAKYFSAKMVGTTPFDITKFDLTQTIFTLMPSVNIQFNSDNTCGFHSSAQFDTATNKFLVAAADGLFYPTSTTVTIIYSFSPASLTVGSGGCNPSYAGQGSLNPILPNITPNGDIIADRLLDTWTHEIFETVSDPGTGSIGDGQSWYNNDDLHLATTLAKKVGGGPPTWTAKGGNNENADLCNSLYGQDPTKLYNTQNANKMATQDPVTKLWPFNANIIVGGKYYLISQEYVYSPNANGVVNTGLSQCAMTTKNLPALPAATSTMTMSFVNTVNDGNGYYLLVLYYTRVNFWKKVWKSPTATYGQSVQFSKVRFHLLLY